MHDQGGECALDQITRDKDQVAPESLGQRQLGKKHQTDDAAGVQHQNAAHGRSHEGTACSTQRRGLGQHSHEQAGDKGCCSPSHEIAGSRGNKGAQSPSAARQQRQTGSHGHHEQQHGLQAPPGPQQATCQHDAQGLDGDGYAQRQVNLGDEPHYGEQGRKQGSHGNGFGMFAC